MESKDNTAFKPESDNSTEIRRRKEGKFRRGWNEDLASVKTSVMLYLDEIAAK